MSERFKAFWLGIFILAALGASVWFLLFLRPSVGDGKLLLRVRFANIERVTIGTRVTFAGKPVGDVIRINEITDARNQVPVKNCDLYFYELVLRVDSSVQVYTYDEIVFSTSGLLGEKSIAIIPKCTPHGMPPARNITNDVLFAKSEDQLQETINEILSVATTFDNALNKIVGVLDRNEANFRDALHNFSEAAVEVRTVFQRVNETHLVENINSAATGISAVTGQIHNGEGTLGKLIANDTLYLQLSSVLWHLDTTLVDINHYGLFFQFDKGWQRKRSLRQCRQRNADPCNFASSFDNEMATISQALEKVATLLDCIKCGGNNVNDPCVNAYLRELLMKVEALENNLKLYNERFCDNFCEP